MKFPVVIFAAATAICSGFGLAMLFETIAIQTGGLTISDLTAATVRDHPLLAALCAVVAGLLLGSLAMHFMGFTKRGAPHWPTVAAFAASILVGIVLTRIFWWRA